MIQTDTSPVQTIDNWKQKFRKWFLIRAQGPHARFWLVFISFTESWILPIPTIFFMATLLLAGTKKWVYFAILTTLASVAGGIFGYFLGLIFFDAIGVYIIEIYSLQGEFLQVQHLYDTYAFGAVLIGALTPLPYKIFVLSAGFLKINLFLFVLASIVGRATHFFIGAYIVKLFGKQVARISYRYFTLITIFALIVIFIWLLI